MEPKGNKRTWIPYTVSILMAILFIYAANSKLFDFQQFRIQLGQSPILTAYAGWVAWAVPLVEYLLAFALLWGRIRLWALYGSLGLLVMFTAYIVLVLNFSDYIPCSCGGVLEELGWTEHIIFNLCFVVLAFLAIWVMEHQSLEDKGKRKRTSLRILGNSSLGIGIVLVLFLTSEHQVHRNNAFTRRYPPHPVVKKYDLDIGFNSYYIAGFAGDLLYLGNSTAPWHMLQVNLKTRDTSHIQLEPRNREIKYRSLKVAVLPPYFFVMDGTMPFILRGKVFDWIAEPWMEGTAYFTKGIPVDSNKVFIRTTLAQTQKSTLGLIEKKEDFQVRLDTTLLEAQIDGVFDVDGMLVRSENRQKLGYVYYYRNQFITMDSGFKNINRQKTIDTVQKAQIEVAEKNRAGRIQMQAPPLTINKTASMTNDLMMVQSDRLGRNESEEMLAQASIIDVYDCHGNTYEFSFYLYNIQKHKAREFVLQNDRMFALIDNHVSVYSTVDAYFDQNKTESIKETTGQ